jgi:hypothetical protein
MRMIVIVNNLLKIIKRHVEIIKILNYSNPEGVNIQDNEDIYK